MGTGWWLRCMAQQIGLFSTKKRDQILNLKKVIKKEKKKYPK